MFSKPKMPTPKVTTPPTIDDARAKVDSAEISRKRRGRASTMLVGSESAVGTAAKALTGN